MLEPEDPFTGWWRLNAKASRVDASITSWRQQIAAGSDAITVREEIVRSGPAPTVVSVTARFDGTEYPVRGSPVVDAIAYTRADRFTIVGVGTKSGTVVLTETVNADPQANRMTLDYRIHRAGQVVASGLACFDRIDREVISELRRTQKSPDCL